MIKNKVLPWVDEIFGNTGVTFQQDGATSHTAKLVQDFCEKTSRTFGLKIYGPHLLPISTHLLPISTQWILEYGRYWSRMLAQNLIKMLTC